jgi:hypothetical protein
MKDKVLLIHHSSFRIHHLLRAVRGESYYRPAQDRAAGVRKGRRAVEGVATLVARDGCG